MAEFYGLCMFYARSARYTLWLFNIAMDNGPFIDDFPINTSIYKGCSMAMLVYQRVRYNDLILLGFQLTTLQLGTIHGETKRQQGGLPGDH